MTFPRERVAGLLLGYAADRLLGDPQRGHPVAGFGAAAAATQRRMYADSRGRGASYAGLLVGGTVLLAAAGERACRPSVARILCTAWATWVTLGGRSLEREATTIARLLESDDLDAARRRVRHLVGRTTDDLDSEQIARAVVESVAENTSDAVVAPLLWGGVAGVPGLLGYRAVNTLDAMVGHPSPDYRQFGWACARLDDWANLPASRLSGLLCLITAPAKAGAVWRTWRRDAAAHPSPNAGVVEAGLAGALGVRLGGTNTYPGSGTEDRTVLGSGPSPDASDISRAVQLARRIGIGAVIIAAGTAATSGRARGFLDRIRVFGRPRRKC